MLQIRKVPRFFFSLFMKIYVVTNYSIEASLLKNFNEYSQHMSLWTNKIIFF